MDEQVTPVLKSLGLLDAPAEPEIDVLLELATQRLGTPVALLSIIDHVKERQFFKGAIGLGEPWASLRETPLTHSFCQHVVADNAPLIVTDARADDRVSDNKAITDLDVIAYLGCPVGWDPDAPVGAICAIQDSPRSWSDDDLRALEGIASAIATNINLRVALAAETQAKHEALAAQTAQSLANERLIDLTDNMPAAMFQYVRNSDGTGIMTFVSNSCEQTLGVTADALRADPTALWHGVDPGEVDRLRANLENAANTLQPWNERWQAVSPDGKKRWLQGFGTPKTTQNGTHIWNAAIFDTTEVVEAERQISLQQELLQDSQRNESIARIAGGVAHHFNNMIFAAQGGIEAIKDDADQDLHPALDDLETMLTEGGQLTKQLLSIAQRSTPTTDVHDAADCLRGIADLLPHRLRPEVKFEIKDSGQKHYTCMDRGLFETAVVNMVSNSYDAIDGLGTITVSLENVTLTADDSLVQWGQLEPADYVICTVTDSGTGIKADIRKQILDPYFSTKSPENGSGLGLVAAVACAQVSHGIVLPLPNPNGGTMMKMFLQAKQPAAPATAHAPQTAIAKPVPEEVCILFAEDHPAVRDITTTMLKKEGFKVIAAEDADKALAKFNESPEEIDLILTDVLMPGSMYGPQLVKTIRASHPHMPAIFVSGYTASAFEDADLDSERDIFLTKAVKRADLLNAIETALTH